MITMLEIAFSIYLFSFFSSPKAYRYMKLISYTNSSRLQMTIILEIAIGSDEISNIIKDINTLYPIKMRWNLLS